MGLFRKKKKKDKYDVVYENLYDKIKLEPKGDNESTNIDLDKDIIEEAYQEEMTINSKRDEQSYLENCCEQIAIASSRVDDAKKEYLIVGKYLDDILAIENAPKPYSNDIKYYAKRIVTLKEDKKSLKQYAAKMSDKKYAYIEAHEDKMSGILKDMYEDEQYLQSLKTDMHHIEGEKAALKYEKKKATEALYKIRSWIKLLTVLLIITIIMFFVLQLAFQLDMLIPSLLIMTLGAGGAAFIVVYNQKQERDKKIAELKLNKAIGLINKYKLKYVNVKARLDYEYETIGVKSSYALNELWRQYTVIKKEREAIMKASDELYKSMEGLIKALDGLKLYDSAVWTSQVEALIDNREMTEVRHALNIRRQKLRESIDFNTKTVEKNKERISEIVKKNPEVAKEVIEIIERYE